MLLQCWRNGSLSFADEVLNVRVCRPKYSRSYECSLNGDRLEEAGLEYVLNALETYL